MKHKERMPFAKQLVLWTLVGGVILTSTPYLGGFVSQNAALSHPILARLGISEVWEIILRVILRNVLAAFLPYLGLYLLSGDRVGALAGALLYLLNPLRLQVLYCTRNTVIWAPIGLACAVLAGILLPRMEKRVRNRVALLLGLLLLAAAVYTLNEIIYEMVPRYPGSDLVLEG